MKERRHSHNDARRSQAADPPRKRSTGDLWAIMLLAGVLVFLYWDFLIGRSYVSDDSLSQFYPGLNYFAKSIASGRFPLWFPGVRDGSPFYSDTQIAVFYPLEWLLPLFVNAGRLSFIDYQRYIFLHGLLGAMFAYAYLRGLKLSPLSALVGGFAFTLSGFFASRMTVNVVEVEVYTWLPLQLLFVHQFYSKGGRWRWLGLVGAMELSLLGGFPQVTLYCWYLVVAYWLYLGCLRQRGKAPDWKTALMRCATREVPKLVGTYAVVFGIAAATLLPGLENWSHSPRPKQSFQQIADTSLPYRGLVRLFVPNFFGSWEIQHGTSNFWGADPQSPNVLQTATSALVTAHSAQISPGFWHYWECNAYSGQLFWVAMVLILYNWKLVQDKRTVGFFLVVWLMAVWFMLGRYGGLFNVLYHVLPGVSLFRVPARMSCVATLAAAVVIAYFVELAWREGTKVRLWPALLIPAGYVVFLAVVSLGGEHLLAELRDADKLRVAQDEIWYTLAVAAVTVAAIWAACRTKPSSRMVGLLALAAVFVADADHGCGGLTTRFDDPDVYYTVANVPLAQLAAQRAQQGPFRVGQVSEGRITEERAWHRNLAYFSDLLEVPEGYTSYYLDSISQFQSITNEQAKTDIQNIKIAIKWNPHDDVGSAYFVDCLPRAKFYSYVRRYDSRGALLAALDRNEIDWHAETAVWGSDPLGADREMDRNPPVGTNDEVRFVAKTPEAYSIVYNVSRPGIVFVSQAFYPGWIADDGKFKIVEVFGAFQGIVIPEAGHGEINVTFSPPILKWALAISSLSVMIAILIAVFITQGDSSPATSSP